MTKKKGFVVYVDHTVLSLLPKHVHDSDPVFDDWDASRVLWRKFREEKIKLVTHRKATELDIILWINRQGCCITDTLRAMEAINEFEAWNKIEKSSIQQYKQILTYFEELELLHLPGGNFDEGYPTNDEIAEVLKLKPVEPDSTKTMTEDSNLLRGCLADLGNWYTDDLWRDLKRTNYQLNWQILESILAKHGIEPIFYGTGGDSNRHLFGLLNRAVGLTKKSCGKLPVPDNHINFVTAMVIKKYSYDQGLRGISHILHCIEHHINFYVTINHHLTQAFSRHRTILQEYLQIQPLDLELMAPKTFMSEVASGEEKS